MLTTHRQEIEDRLWGKEPPPPEVPPTTEEAERIARMDLDTDALFKRTGQQIIASSAKRVEGLRSERDILSRRITEVAAQIKAEEDRQLTIMAALEAVDGVALDAPPESEGLQAFLQSVGQRPQSIASVPLPEPPATQEQPKDDQHIGRRFGSAAKTNVALRVWQERYEQTHDRWIAVTMTELAVRDGIETDYKRAYSQIASRLKSLVQDKKARRIAPGVYAPVAS